MPSTARIILTGVILLGILLLIDWGAWRNMHRMWSDHVRFIWIRRAWFTLSTIQMVWFVIYAVQWPAWREHHPGYLLVTHAFLLSLLFPKLWLVGTEMVEGLRYGVQWLFTSSEARGGIPRRTFLTMTGQATAGLILGAFAHGMTRGR